MAIAIDNCRVEISLCKDPLSWATRINAKAPCLKLRGPVSLPEVIISQGESMWPNVTGGSFILSLALYVKSTA